MRADPSELEIHHGDNEDQRHLGAIRKMGDTNEACISILKRHAEPLFEMARVSA